MQHDDEPLVRRLEELLRGYPALAELIDRHDEFRLDEAWVVAGAIAQTVWNATAGRPPGFGIEDIDLIHVDRADLSPLADREHQARLGAMMSLGKPLDVVNQARVHLWHRDALGRSITPLRSSRDAIAAFPTTATAIGVRRRRGAFEVFAPFGLADLFAGIVRPNLAIVSRSVYEAKADRWRRAWRHLSILPWPETTAVPP